ncbi:unnamed protein product [Rotaria sordida]|uniref:Uncharacterized protein n=2 Tax=Rotaria sordida TaxID=392033 RepID=A0A819THM6_9BILA|nr:unnamed protein product [Rotaria sordida]CAF3997749.1 unnamed protein product [Rotaria sordida]CAF4073312.1 unnamed protein product [Rotaria sordida]
MPQIGSCTDITCDDELKELYECHCCLRLVCLYHLNGHVEITKQNKHRTDRLCKELNTIVNTLQLIIDEKLSTIKCEHNLIEQAKKILDISNSSIDELEDIFEKINQTITLNRSESMVKIEPLLSETTHRFSSVCEFNKENINDVAEESEISKDNEYSTNINHDFIETITLDDTDESIQDDHINEETTKRKRKSFRKLYAKCPLTFDGAYGLTKANHSIEFCEHGTTRRIELYYHFIYTHQLKKVYAQRLIQAIADHKDSRMTKLFDENEDVINHFYKVSCPFSHGQVNSLKHNGQNVIISPCQYRSITFHKLAYHLRLSHKISKSLAEKLVDDFKKNRIENDIVLTPLISST